MTSRFLLTKDTQSKKRMVNKMKIFEPQPSDPNNPAVVVETKEGRFIVESNGGPVEQAWGRRRPYTGAVRRDPITSTLRGLAWTLGIPGGKNAEVGP